MKSDHFFAAVSVSHQLMFITMFFSSVNLARWLLFAWQEEIYKLSFCIFTDVALNTYDNLWWLLLYKLLILFLLTTHDHRKMNIEIDMKLEM